MSASRHHYSPLWDTPPPGLYTNAAARLLPSRDQHAFHLFTSSPLIAINVHATLFKTTRDAALLTSKFVNWLKMFTPGKRKYHEKTLLIHAHVVPQLRADQLMKSFNGRSELAILLFPESCVKINP